jgi:branched-chain amino acid transport system permease protein
MDFSKINWKKTPLSMGIPLALLVVLVFMPKYGWEYGVTLFNHFLLFIILSVSWTIFSGTTGYISLATAAFFGIGIYSSALLYPTVGDRYPLFVVVLIGGAVSFVLAFIVGAITLRLKGIYFAMFTFGLVLFFKEVIYWYEITEKGIRGRLVALESNDTIYYYLLGIMALTMLVAFLIKRSKYGLALQSIGENEEAAAHMGVNITMIKVLTYAISATFMGAVGVIMATKWTYVDPGVAFAPMMSFSPVLMAIFGGFGSIYGPVIGAVIFSYIEEILKTGDWSKYYMLIFGTILVVTILFLPGGLVGLIQNVWRRVMGRRRAPA